MSSDYDDSHLAAIYDHDNPSGADHDFYRELADELHARVIVDLGCGTGLLTAQLVRARAGDDAKDAGFTEDLARVGESDCARRAAGDGYRRRVVGIDPAQAMLDVARSKPDAEHVEWVCGTSPAMRGIAADLVLLTGNAAMHILGQDWVDTLDDVAHSLVPGGALAFETRNPDAQAWLQWNGPGTVRDTPLGPLRESWRTSPPDANGVVVMHLENLFLEDGYDASFTQRLQFRSFDQVASDLRGVGLELAACYRDWERTPFTGGEDQPLMVFVAKKPLD